MMNKCRRVAGVTAAVFLLPIWAPPVLAQTAPIHGQGVMDDRNRSGPDGIVQAPIPRVEAPSGRSPGESNPDRSADSRPRPVADTGKHLTAGQDPGTPERPHATSRN